MIISKTVLNSNVYPRHIAKKLQARQYLQNGLYGLYPLNMYLMIFKPILMIIYICISGILKKLRLKPGFRYKMSI